MPSKPFNVPIPFSGLNDNTAFQDQPPYTTRSCQNVRPFDSVNSVGRLSRRGGMSKFLATQISNGPIQLIDSIIIARDQRVGTGDVLCQGATTTTGAIRTISAGASQSITGTFTPIGANSQGCYDEDGNAYYVSASTSGTATVRVTKIGTDYAAKWTANITPGGAGNPQLFGCAAFDGILYLYIVSATAGSITNPGIYRIATSDGSLGTLWLNNASNGIATVGGTQTAACQCLAVGGGMMGLVGAISGALVFQRIVIATGTVVGQVMLQSTLLNHPAKLITDSGNNFYVLTNCTGGAVNKLFKINSSGILDTAFGTAGVVTSDTNTATDIAYNPITFQIGIVGTDIFNATNESFQTYDATTGGKFAGAQHDTFNWDAIAADDQTTSGWRLRRSVAAANNDLVYTKGPGVADTWAAQTGLGVVTPHLWLACSGVQVAPADSTMQSTRLTREIAICNGGLYRFDSGVSNISTTFASASAPVVWGTQCGLIMVFTDGSNKYPIYNASTNTAGVLAASAGTLPGDPNGNKCRLCCTWRGRPVFAGLVSDPNNWFMGAVDSVVSSTTGATANFDYAPVTVLATQAVAGSNAPAGLCGDAITCLIPYSDDLLIMGCERSIWVMQGDPMAGGRIINITMDTGMAWGRPYCTDPSGNLYFFGSRGSVYRMTPEGKPERISEAIDSARFFNVDLSASIVRMAWDDRWRGFHLFISPTNVNTTTTHYWWDSASDRYKPFGSWWPDVFANVNLNPLAVYVLQGDAPGTRVTMMGGRDGYIRQFDASVTDDGSTVTASCLLGPVYDHNGFPSRMNDLQATMASGSGNVTYSVKPGESIEAAYNATGHATGTFSASRNRSQAIRVYGHALFVNLSGTTQWSLDGLRAVMEPVESLVAQRSW
jgi:hypothetical protein